MHLKKILFILIATSVITPLALAGPGWTQPKGKGFFLLRENIILAENFYNDKGKVDPIMTSGIFISEFYGEYGLFKRLTLGAYVPFVFHSIVNGREFTSGAPKEPGLEATDFGDLDFFLRLGLIQNSPFVASLSLNLGFPTGQSDSIPASGDGEFNQLVKLELGYGFQKLPLFANLEFGFNNRTNSFSDELRLNAQVGYTFGKNLLILLKSRNIWSLNNGDDTNISGGGIFSNNIEFTSFGPEVLLFNVFGRFGLLANFFGAFRGANVLAAPSFSLGVFLDTSR